MGATATVNYHIHKQERQAFELDAGGIAGNLISPELVETRVTVQDERNNDVVTSFKQASVAFAAFDTSVDVLDDDHAWQTTYEDEIHKLNC